MSKIKLAAGDEMHGFRLKRSQPLPELSAVIHELEHMRTKARYLHFENSDDNNLFAVGFRTPPVDSTGSPHILEHTVLCGSKGYPVRDPFFSMLKRSLNTFMNAMTSSDWTLYPFSSQNRTDFYNLMRVYLDAVLFPLLKEDDFNQEGHRLEFADPADPESALEIKGVVYNEMKGAMSDPHSLLSARMDEIIYPTAAYGKNSGGDPKHIPELTCQALRDFHASCYHPSNSYLFSYGDMPLENHLAVIEDEFFSGFNAIEVKTEVAKEARFSEPISVKTGYPLDEGESTEGKSMVHLAWLACDISDDVERLGMELLSSLLLGNPSTPLYKALLDSKLGSNLTPGSGYNSEYRDTQFGVGLQNCDENSAPAVAELILSTLLDAAEKGFPKEKVDGAFQQLEFEHREVRGVHGPYSLGLLIHLMGPWIHGADPVRPLLLDENLGDLGRRIDSGPFLSDLIRKHLLDNPHRATLVLSPDAELEKKEAMELAEKLERIKAGLSDERKREIVEQAKALQTAQEAEPDLSLLPTVEISDIPEKSRSTESTRSAAAGVSTLEFNQPTNGIGYFFAHLNLGGLTGEEEACLPLFCSMLTQVGAAGKSYTEMAERIAAATGGVKAGVALLESPDVVGKYEALLEFEGRALARFQGKLFEIMGDVFSSPDFSDLDRIHTVINQLRTKLENSLPNQGHRYAAKAAAAMLSPAARMWEKWTGVEYVRKVKSLAALGVEEQAGTAALFSGLARKILSSGAMECALVSEARCLQAMEAEAASFVSRLRASESSSVLARVENADDSAAFKPKNLRLGLAANVPVSFAAKVFSCAAFTHPDAAGLLVLSKLLRAEFLHREIREKGGAYGGIASYSAESGIFTLASYRDPHIVRTLDVFDQAAQWASKESFGEEEVKQAILGAVSDIDRPLSPSEKAAREFSFIRQGLTLEIRQAFREEILKSNPRTLAELADRYLLNQRDKSSTAVVSNQEALEKANESLGSEKLEISRI